MHIRHFTAGRSSPETSLSLSDTSTVFGKLHTIGRRTTTELPCVMVVVDGGSVEEPADAIVLKRGVAVALDRGQARCIRTGARQLFVACDTVGRFLYSTSGMPAYQLPPPADPTLARVFQWLATGERGQSSEAMCRALFDVDVYFDDRRRRTEHPLDNEDFGRCEAFLRAVPEARARLAQCSSLSPVWAGLIECWDQLSRLHQGGQSKALYEQMLLITSPRVEPA